MPQLTNQHVYYLLLDIRDDRCLGSFGILSTNSFYPFKIVGCFGDGGALTTSNSELDYNLRCLRDNGQDREKGEVLFWGWNSRLDNLQAAITYFENLLPLRKMAPDDLDHVDDGADHYDEEESEHQGFQGGNPNLWRF